MGLIRNLSSSLLPLVASLPPIGNILVMQCASNGYAAWDAASANDNVIVCNFMGATAEIPAAGIGVFAS